MFVRFPQIKGNVSQTTLTKFGTPYSILGTPMEIVDYYLHGTPDHM